MRSDAERDLLATAGRPTFLVFIFAHTDVNLDLKTVGASTFKIRGGGGLPLSLSLLPLFFLVHNYNGRASFYEQLFLLSYSTGRTDYMMLSVTC